MERMKETEEKTMKRSLGPGSYLYPMPVLVIGSYGPDGTPDAMTAAWGGIYDTGKIGICLSADHRTVKNILERKAYTVSMATADTAAQADYVGIVSGNDVPDKLERCGLHPVKSETVDAPVFEELPMALECELESYDTENGWMVGRILNVAADESVLGENGKVDCGRLRPVTYDGPGHGYVVLGEKVADAYSAGKKFF